MVRACVLSLTITTSDIQLSFASWRGFRSRTCTEPRSFLAPRVLIKEATADIEILVIAGWQDGPFVFGKPLRESDHSAGRRRWLA
jgi:hypothetical protein